MATPSSALAQFGGTPVRSAPWPKWPVADSHCQRNLLNVLHSELWAISGCSQKQDLFEKQFGSDFADFCGMRYGVPCANGTAALTIAMEALGIGPGDQVIVPGVTWVACPSSVYQLGAVPVLVDIDDKTLCLDLMKVEEAINSKTKAIMAVHLYCSFVDLKKLKKLSKKTGVPVIEDCSQAHGAKWGKQRIGSFGEISTFSLQQSKLLTCGEGGVCLTNNRELYYRMQEFRADGRRYGGTVKPWNDYQIKNSGLESGRNLCMSEFHAAIACAALPRLDQQNQWRRDRAHHLETMLQEVDGVEMVDCPEDVSERTFYRLCFRINRTTFQDASVAAISEAMSHELKLLVDRIDPPLNQHPLYDPRKSPRLKSNKERQQRYNPQLFTLPASEKAYDNCITMPHQMLLGDERDMQEIVMAFRKIQAEIGQHL
ncbi:MAG: DegT/DnrJ/EryC1/StrS family aminotransferase [SAR324 cluster bacterium]|nr:DegT/DnrJ/EryC1/StrS family aminotransferase [SAR324 cluster bacterium]